MLLLHILSKMDKTGMCARGWETKLHGRERIEIDILLLEIHLKLP